MSESEWLFCRRRRERCVRVGGRREEGGVETLEEAAIQMRSAAADAQPSRQLWLRR